jgi:hypothetical protein
MRRSDGLYYQTRLDDWIPCGLFPSSAEVGLGDFGLDAIRVLTELSHRSRNAIMRSTISAVCSAEYLGNGFCGFTNAPQR